MYTWTYGNGINCYLFTAYCEDREKPTESNAELRERVCAQINGDAIQYSLFRRDASPVECPFKGSYTFTYSRGHGECRSPISRLDSCTENWRTFFRYQACPDTGTESSGKSESSVLIGFIYLFYYPFLKKKKTDLSAPF